MNLMDWISCDGHSEGDMLHLVDVIPRSLLLSLYMGIGAFTYGITDVERAFHMQMMNAVCFLQA